jgi:hypothetical protein
MHVVYYIIFFSDDGYVTLTQHFKYLGAWVSDTLNCIKKAQAQMGSPPFLLPMSAYCTNDQVQSLSSYPWQHHALGCELWSINADMQ